MTKSPIMIEVNDVSKEMDLDIIKQNSQEQKIREGLYMIGLKDDNFHFSWFIAYALQDSLPSSRKNVMTDETFNAWKQIFLMNSNSKSWKLRCLTRWNGSKDHLKKGVGENPTIPLVRPL